MWPILGLLLTCFSLATATSLSFTSCTHGLPLTPPTSFSWSVDPDVSHTSLLSYHICAAQPDTLRFVKSLSLAFTAHRFSVVKTYTICPEHSTLCFDQLAQTRCLTGTVRVLAPLHHPVHTQHEVTVLERADRAVLHACHQ